MTFYKPSISVVKYSLSEVAIGILSVKNDAFSLTLVKIHTCTITYMINVSLIVIGLRYIRRFLIG